MLDSQIIANLLEQVRIGADFLGHSHINSMKI
jgi:hypothetical protein